MALAMLHSHCLTTMDFLPQNHSNQHTHNAVNQIPTSNMTSTPALSFFHSPSSLHTLQHPHEPDLVLRQHDQHSHLQSPPQATIHNASTHPNPPRHPRLPPQLYHHKRQELRLPPPPHTQLHPRLAHPPPHLDPHLPPLPPPPLHHQRLPLFLLVLLRYPIRSPAPSVPRHPRLAPSRARDQDAPRHSGLRKLDDVVGFSAEFGGRRAGEGAGEGSGKCGRVCVCGAGVGSVFAGGRGCEVGGGQWGCC